MGRDTIDTGRGTMFVRIKAKEVLMIGCSAQEVLLERDEKEDLGVGCTSQVWKRIYVQTVQKYAPKRPPRPCRQLDSWSESIALMVVDICVYQNSAAGGW